MTTIVEYKLNDEGKKIKVSTTRLPFLPTRTVAREGGR